jgi:aspartyl-tRNA(Asn)/glutamyl-tRNA(Gln) amidotransferase subunit A
MPMASSLDTVGPIAKTAYDAALIMSQIAGQDALDSTTLPDPVPSYLADLEKDLTGVTVGVPKEYFELEGLNATVKESVSLYIEKLKNSGCTIEPVSLPHTKYAIAVYYILVPSEDSSNLGRLDGVRYGVRKTGKDLYDLYAASRAYGFPEEVKRRILIGTYALSAGYYDAYYKKAQTVRTTDVLFKPELQWEKEGIVPNVVFPCGSVIRGDTAYLYYGGADTVTGVATVDVKVLLKALKP